MIIAGPFSLTAIRAWLGDGFDEIEVTGRRVSGVPYCWKLGKKHAAPAIVLIHPTIDIDDSHIHDEWVPPKFDFVTEAKPAWF